MKNYVFLTEIDSKLKAICTEFKLVFNVDIDDPKYNSYNKIEEKWDAILNDICLHDSKKGKEVYVQRFAEMMSLALYGDDIIRCYDIQAERRLGEISDFRKYIHGMQNLLDDYSVYEPDVWMNAYLSIQYIKAKDSIPDNVNIKPSNCVEIDPRYHVESKNVTYIIPFEGYQEGFCTEYVNRILHKDQVQVLGASIYPDEKEYINCYDRKKFYGYNKRINLRVTPDMKFTRWKQDKILSLEQSKNFKTEDKIMFHKTINGSLIRNLVDTMISTEYICDVEDYLYLLEKLCTCRSLNWQNLIGCLYIAVSHLQRELTALDLWLDIKMQFDLWLMNISVVNRRLELLSNGLVYIVYKQDKTFQNLAVIEKKSNESLEKIIKNPFMFSNGIDKIIRSEWESQPSELRYSKKVEINHRQYFWIYAIMQRYVIDSMTPKICNEFMEKEIDWYDVISTIAKKLEKEISIFEYRMNIGNNGRKNCRIAIDSIIKIFNDFFPDQDEEEKKIKEKLLNELRKKIIKGRQEDTREKFANEIIKSIYYAYIDIKAKNNYKNVIQTYINDCDIKVKVRMNNREMK